MSSTATPRQRRRNVLTCLECRKRKQKCDRGFPCMQCVARGTERLCNYEKTKLHSAYTARGLPRSSQSNPNEVIGKPEAPATLRHAYDYGYSDSNSLNSMGMLTKIVTDMDVDILAMSQPAVALEVQNRVRSEYYAYVRRIPPKVPCEVLFKCFFNGLNNLNAALDETIFREQLDHWWTLAHEVLLKQGPEKLPDDLRCFPALIFQVLALALQFLPLSLEPQVDELKFSPLQTFAELSREYSDCGMALSNLLEKSRPTLVGVQQSFLRGCWLTNTGDVMQSWNHSGQTVKDAMATGLHLEPIVPSSSQPEALLDALWINELRKRTWLNLVVWDNYMAIALGRPMFIDLKDCTVTAPIDCNIPTNRLQRVPVARSDLDMPTPMTERVLRLKLTRRFCEIRQLEAEGPIPRDPEKVKELHHFAVNFRKTLPEFYRISNPDIRWDEQCPFVPTQRELLSHLVDSFFMALHRPYIFTREKSQRQVYESSIAILDSQDRLFEIIRNSQTPFYISLVFPTFDAAVLLAVVLVSNPERYHTSFSRPYQCLQKSLERLSFIGSIMELAKAGAGILQSTLRRVIEAQELSGFPVEELPGNISSVHTHAMPVSEVPMKSSGGSSVNMSPDADPWYFQLDQSSMDWIVQNPEFSEFDFSNLAVPMPLKELLLDEEMIALEAGNIFNPDLWVPAQDQQDQQYSSSQEQIVDTDENSLWSFLTGI